MTKRNFKTKLGTAILVTMAMAFGMGGINAKAADNLIDGGSTKEVAINLNYNNSYIAHFDGGNNQDWYTFTPTGDNGFYEIQIKNMNIETGGNGHFGFHAYIMNDVGDVFADIDTHKNEMTTNKFKLTNKTEKMYIKFELGEGLLGNEPTVNAGNYRIALNRVADDVGDTMDNATTLKNRKSVAKKMNDYLTFDTSVYQEDSTLWYYNEGGMTDVDFFQFTAPKTGKYQISLTNCNMDNAGNDWHQLNSCVYSRYEEILGNNSVCKNETGTYTVKLEKNQTYYVKVFLGQNIPRNCGDYKLKITDVDYLNAIKAPTKVKAKLKGNKIEVTWKKQKAVSKYVVYRSVNGGKFKKVATVKKAAYTDKKIVKGKKYQYKVVSSKMTDKTNVLSKAKSSKTKKIRVKKK